MKTLKRKREMSAFGYGPWDILLNDELTSHGGPELVSNSPTRAPYPHKPWVAPAMNPEARAAAAAAIAKQRAEIRRDKGRPDTEEVHPIVPGVRVADEPPRAAPKSDVIIRAQAAARNAVAALTGAAATPNNAQSNNPTSSRDPSANAASSSSSIGARPSSNPPASSSGAASSSAARSSNNRGRAGIPSGTDALSSGVVPGLAAGRNAPPRPQEQRNALSDAPSSSRTVSLRRPPPRSSSSEDEAPFTVSRNCVDGKRRRIPSYSSDDENSPPANVLPNGQPEIPNANIQIREEAESQPSNGWRDASGLGWSQTSGNGNNQQVAVRDWQAIRNAFISSHSYAASERKIAAQAASTSIEDCRVDAKKMRCTKCGILFDTASSKHFDPHSNKCGGHKFTEQSSKAAEKDTLLWKTNVLQDSLITKEKIRQMLNDFGPHQTAKLLDGAIYFGHHVGAAKATEFAPVRALMELMD